ncbi:MAG TPA: hypothetical protein VKP60_02195 [Magnetospirillaceae bacterium]|nr:hypothetical protein [Magnetospirillaceae bacterium]
MSHSTTSKSATAGIVAGAALLLMLPALWNGFPFLFWDSGDYLTATLTGERVVYRDPVYGFLAAPLHAGYSLWGVAAGQCLLSAWVLWETLRQLHPRQGREAIYLALAALLAFGTSLPWFAGQIMPDIMGALAVPMIFVLATGDLSAPKRIVLGVLLAAALACHLSFLPLGVGLLLVLLMVYWPLARRGLTLRLGAIAAAVAAAPALVVCANLALGGPPVLSQTSHAFLLARLVQDGLARQTLERICPDPALKLCELKDRLPPTANDFLWGDSEAFVRVGGWLDSKREADRIIWASLRLFPGEHLASAATLSAHQLISFSTGDGLESQAEPWGLIEAHFPTDLPSYSAARQQTGRLPLAEINLLQVPLAAASMGLLPWLALMAWRRGRWREVTGLLMVGGALLGNAVICGVLSNPNARYESRMVWLAVFAAGLAVADWVQGLETARRAPRPAGEA